MKSVYRKVSLERLSSPEQLDMLVQVTDVRGWLALSAIGILLVMVIGWGIWGRIPSQINMPAIVLNNNEGAEATAAQQAKLYVPYEESGTLAEGMVVTITPRNGTGAAVEGKISSIGQLPVSPATIANELGSEALTAVLVTSATPVEVIVTLEDTAVSPQTLADATILVSEDRPIDLVIPLR
ncbi:MAG: hypothetical protein H6652_18195 [Ardenticatenaceae bacterium]|nr:hypothetical protein [Ardenticatenaceae bacterium]